METNQKIDFSITETLKAHPEFIPNVNVIVYRNISSPTGIQLRNFTSRNGARQAISTVTQQDILIFVLEELIKIYNSIVYFYYNDREMQRLGSDIAKMNFLLQVFPNYPVINQAIRVLSNPEINAITYFMNNEKDLIAVVDSVTATKYQRNQKYADYVEEHGKTRTYIDGLGECDLFYKLKEDVRKVSVARNVNVNRRAVNQCLSDIMSGAQLKNKRNEYGLSGDLFASQDIGKRRNNQEDSVLILNHPDNDEFKFLAVADGMGGVELGDKASQYTMQQLANWFRELPADAFYYPLELQEALNKKIAEISNYIYITYNEPYNSIQAGTTLSAAIVTSEKTIVSTIGDSRVYTTNQNRLNLISHDESAVWPPKRKEDITSKELDEIRFNRRNNEILRCIGDRMDYRTVQTLITPNNSYDRLLLFSDGVTDLLSQERIKVLSTQAPKELVTKLLVDEAITYDAYRNLGEDEFNRGMIPAGKDNASAVMYARR